MAKLYIVYNDNTDQFTSGKDILQLPVNPAEVNLKQGSNNQTMELINIGEVNVVKKPKLQEVSFDSFFPRVIPGVPVNAPYIVAENIKNPDDYVNIFYKIKSTKQIIQFIIADYFDSGQAYNEWVTVEEFSHTLTPDGDINYSVTMKIYQPYSAKVLDANGKVVSHSRVLTKVIPPTYTVKEDGEKLPAIGKQTLGTGSGYKQIMSLNNIFDPATWLAKGTTLKIPNVSGITGGLNNVTRYLGINTGTLTFAQVQRMITNGVSIPKLVDIQLDTIKSRAISNLGNIEINDLENLNLPASILNGLF